MSTEDTRKKHVEQHHLLNCIASSKTTMAGAMASSRRHTATSNVSQLRGVKGDLQAWQPPATTTRLCLSISGRVSL